MQKQYTCETCGKSFRGRWGKPNRFCNSACYSRRFPHKPVTERFWAKVDRNGPVPVHRPELGPCWVWTGCKDRAGYGRIGRGSKEAGVEAAHRMAWELAFGSLPEEGEICHHCDNPACVRLSHLFYGTHAENMADARAKGIVRTDWMLGYPHRGEAHGLAKLTEPQVREIRRRCQEERVSRADLAREYGVSHQTITDIVRRRRWKHVE